MVTPLDAFTRMQVLLERFKLNQSLQFVDVTKQISRKLRLLFSELDVTDMHALTRVQLRRFVAKVRQMVSEIMAAYADAYTATLMKFSAIEATLTRAVMIACTDGATLYDEKRSRKIVPIYGWASTTDDTRLWSFIYNEPIPAFGYAMDGVITNIVSSVTASVVQRVTQGYANAESVSDTLGAITGTDKLFGRDGLLNASIRRVSSFTNTAIQSVSSLVQSAIASAYAENYEWVSILDSKTTVICQDRNGQIFSYKDGPQPPAHVNCRSRIIPIVGTFPASGAPTFGAWFKAQPASVRDFLGVYPVTRPLTLNELSGSLKTILE